MSSISLAGIELSDPEGRSVPIGSLLDPDSGDRWLVLQAIRYYG